MFKKLSILLLVLVFIAGFTVTAMATPPVSPPSSLDGVYKFTTSMKCKKLSDGKFFKIKKISKKRWVSLRFVDDPNTELENVGDYKGNVYGSYDKKTNTLSDPLKNADGEYVEFYIDFEGTRTWDTDTAQFLPETEGLASETSTKIVDGGFYDNFSENNKIPNLYCDMDLQGKFRGKKPKGFNRYRMNGWNCDTCYTPFPMTPTVGDPYNKESLQAKCKSNWRLKRVNDLPENEGITQLLDVVNNTGAGGPTISDTVITGCDPGEAGPGDDGCTGKVNRYTTVELTATPALAGPGSWVGCDAATDATCTVVMDEDKTVADGTEIQAN